MNVYLLFVAGRWAGLLAMCVLLFQLVTMGQGRTAEKFVGKPILSKLHFTCGWIAAVLVGMHAGLILTARSVSYGDGYAKTWAEFMLDGSWGSATLAGITLFTVALACAALFRRRRLSYATFRKTHFLMYPAAALLFGHQIFCGLDFVNSVTLRTAWMAFCGLFVADVVVWKVRSIKWK